ncbi:Crp/Fnr family transcriptional regulator [Candidatus Acetothermia bacterium]|nr:Crp/Fnr family transcriptional regulator [Candidatus Acetothermia bacterium]
MAHSPRKLLFEEGAPIGGCYVICQGKVKLAKRLVCGRHMIIKVAGPSSILGGELLLGENWHRYYAEVLEDTQLCVIDRTILGELSKRYPSFAQRLLLHFVQETIELQRRLEHVLQPGTMEKLLSMALDWARQSGHLTERNQIRYEVQVPLQSQELAALLGCGRETISRCLSEARKHGWIDDSSKSTWYINVDDSFLFMVGQDRAELLATSSL